eukprot:NODE_826_length_3671_cov_0.402296.p1 type:complete len:914 gc:universal NODE_826_length_3671_cov_0.402296:208-2949(+)
MECDRMAVYILKQLEDITQVSTGSQFCHTLKIHGKFISFIYIPPRMHSRMNVIYNEMHTAISNKSLLIGDTNKKCPSLQTGHDNHGRDFEIRMAQKSYYPRNTPLQSTMVNSSNVLDQVWSHSSTSHQISAISVLENEITSSDHFPILFSISLDSPISVLRNIHWNIIKHDYDLRTKLQNYYQNKFGQIHANFDNLTVEEIWNRVFTIALNGAAKVLPVTTYKDGQIVNDLDSKILNLSNRKKRLKRLLSRRNISSDRSVNLKNRIKEIDKSRKKLINLNNKNQFDKYLNKVDDSQSAAFIELCRLRRSSQQEIRRTKCELQQTLDFHKDHFQHHSAGSNWPNRTDTSYSQVVDTANNIFTYDRVAFMFKHINSNKISGDQLPGVFFKYLPEIGIDLLTKFFKKCYINNEFPFTWQISSVVEIFKSGNIHDPGRYRPISLISVCYKCFQQILYYNVYRDKLFPSQRQHGFVKSRSCASQIYSLLQKMTNFRSTKNSVHCLAMDLSTAFDSVIHEDIYEHLSPFLNRHDLNIMKNIICNQSFTLRRDSTNTQIDMRCGTPQGGNMSPMVFSFIMDRLLQIFPGDDNSEIFIYADDLMVITHSITHLQSITNQITRHLSDHGFNVNCAKFQLISSDPSVESVLLNEDILISKQPYLKYLGSFIDSRGINYEKDINSKLTKVNLAISSISWTNNYLQFKESFNKFYTCVLSPIYCYGIENYSMDGLQLLENHRKSIIKNIHKQKYRYFSLKHNYLDIFHQYQAKLIAFNKQLHNLNVLQIPMLFEDKKDIIRDNMMGMQDMWDSQPQTNRASNFKSDSLLLRLAMKKNPRHLQVLYDGFLTGTLPRKTINNAIVYCRHCHREFKSLDHYEDECSNDQLEYKNRNLIYSNLQSDTKLRIISQLKELRDATYIRYRTR